MRANRPNRASGCLSDTGCLLALLLTVSLSQAADPTGAAISALEHLRQGRVKAAQLPVTARAYTICPKADIDSCDQNTIIDTNYEEFVFPGIGGSRSDTLTLLVEHASDRSIVGIGRRRFPLHAITMDTILPTSIDLRMRPAFTVKTRSRSYGCFIGGGTGVYHSGSFQSVGFYLVYDEAAPDPVVILSAVNSIRSLVDLDSDGRLDSVRYSVRDTGSHAGALCPGVLKGTPAGFVPVDTAVKGLGPIGWQAPGRTAGGGH